MRIEIHTPDPSFLIEKIKGDIAADKIKTWSIVLDADKRQYLTHKPEQWFKKALLKPSIGAIPQRLILTVTWFSNSIPTEYIKGFYVGRFTEVLLEHYKLDFSKLETYP